jgi:acyl-CoA-binding protein
MLPFSSCKQRTLYSPPANAIMLKNYMLIKQKLLLQVEKDKPGTLAKANDLEEGKRVYMQETLDHLSCYQFYLNEHAH